ncbi:hypothetical protein CANARDRAFT_125914 [[Candida] arabinofermentans NRRL YB-2248]|uniref:Altered inheritance of mitochondria protein 11 n=1 Tax=[Candida] arabinofermentans NRRL YB-2248 TaxID=983967 RepID=A0A1E4SSQ9_9ASCO|nr:hypothetical protein CANARDRAFT_125914 [[Candida] arabinofermentans NRRL YB-2248]
MSSIGIDFGKVLGKSSNPKSEAVVKYNERRFYQAAIFYSFTIVTYVASKIAYRGIIRRRYLPNFYQHNHVPPKFSFYKDALSAVTHASLLATSSLAMFTTGAFWYFDISSVSEFGIRMKRYMGGAEAEEELSKMPIDQETLDLQNMLTDLISGDSDEKK